MQKEFIPYEQAVALKELGFDEPCFGYRDGVGHLMIKSMPHCAISAPTFSQAFRWFREKKLGAIVSQFGWGIENEFGQIIYNSNDETHLCYEEAELECLNKLIEIIKTK